MTVLTNHETAIIGEILRYKAIKGSFIQEFQIAGHLEKKGFSRTATAIKILGLKKEKQLIKSVRLDRHSEDEGYSLTDKGEGYVLSNVALFEAEEESEKELDNPF